MATVPDTTPKPAAHDPRVYHPLDQLRGIIRRYVVYEGVLAVLIFLAAWYALALALDYGVFKAFTWDWVQDGGKWVRVVALAGGLLLLAGILVFRIGRRLAKEFSYPALALVLERRFPKVLGDRLITAVELADVEGAARHGYSAAMVRATIDEARERVGTVPVTEVFNWRRLWLMGGLAVGILLAVVAAAFASHAVATGSFSPVRAGWKLYHVSAVLAERDLFLMGTPWPRRALIRLEGVPDSGLRLPQHSPSAELRVRAYRWVVADRGTYDGWRPLVWGDVTEPLVGVPVPELPFQNFNWVGASGRSMPATEVSVDAIMAARENKEARAFLSELMGGDQYLELQRVFDRLDEMADDPSLERKIRRLDLPSEVSFEYAGARTAGSGPLTAKENNLYAGVIGGGDEKTKLKEDVQFLVQAEDYRTPVRSITLVPAPVLSRLTRVEYQPAYLHYASPLVPDPAKPDQLVAGGWSELSGLRQRMPEEKVPLTGDNSVIVVPTGTEVVISGETELPIEKAWVIPDTGAVPGARPGSQEPVPLPVRDGNTFELAFRGEYRIRSQVKFTLKFENADGITSTRTVLIQVTADQAPVVEIAPEAIRRVANLYYITPRARIPFNAESYLRDDNGLSKVAYTSAHWPDDANAIQGLRGGQLLRSLVVPLSLHDPGAAGRELATFAHALVSDKANSRREGSFPLGQFVLSDRNLRRETKDRILKLLQEPLATEKPDLVRKLGLRYEIVRDEEYTEPVRVTVRQPDGTTAEREFRYLKRLARRVDGDFFDVSRLNLEAPPGDIQPQYLLELNVQATDTNFDTGPGVSGNADPLKFKIVSAGDLLVKIGEEEGALGAKLDEAIDKIAKARVKYDFVNSKNGFAPPDQLDVVKVRAKDASQDVVKAREIVQAVSREFRRLEKECVINQLDDKNIAQHGKTANSLDRLLGENPQPADVEESRRVYDQDIAIAQGTQPPRPTFVRTEDLMRLAQNNLDQGRWADPAAVTDANIELNRVFERLTDIRKSIGGTQSKEFLIGLVRSLRDQQERIGLQLAAAERIDAERRTAPTPELVAIGPVFLAKGETRKLKQNINWRQYKEDALTVKVEASDKAALVVPAELKLDFDKNQFDFEYEVRAANKEGDYTITLTPAAGDKVEVKVTVK